MNAISKGVSIGLYDEAKKNGVEANKGGSQPYVDLMGRRYVLLSPPVTLAQLADNGHHLPISHPFTILECTSSFLS